MSDLIERARLTDEEIQARTVGDGLRHLSDVATAKALWAAVDWLEEMDDSDGKHTAKVCLPCLAFTLWNLLDEAGIERPASLDRRGNDTADTVLASGAP